MYFIIADDLTGATDTGIQFQKRGIATTVLVEPPKETWPCLGENTALSINASSRELCPQEAAVRTREVLQHMVLCDQDTLFKKVDSLMRGNPVEELEASLEAAGRRIALAAPSFPRMGRTVDGGVLHLPDGSAKDLLTLFKNHAHMTVCHIPLARLRTEGAGLASTLVRREAPLLCLIDAVTEADLSLVAEIGQALDAPPVYCGSAALAEAVQCTVPPDCQARFSCYRLPEEGDSGTSSALGGCLRTTQGFIEFRVPTARTCSCGDFTSCTETIRAAAAGVRCDTGL